ncbi:MAG: glucose-6-phosphate dehydrogenase (NADP(+)), partial [Acidobacteria bacterium]|nr:glucose-6-phosphate dehydrogenase (NADP(+)) [Acidobacteriota bacterium]
MSVSATSQPKAPAGAERQPAPPCVLVIFGASGDLAKRKLIPALYNLAAGSFLPNEFAVLGVSRTPMSDDEFRKKMVEDLHTFETGTLDQQRVDWLKGRLSYTSGDFDQPATFERLRETLAALDERWGTGGSYLFYLAVPPSQFAAIIRCLGDARLTCEEPGKWRRVVIEKPFGHDLESARRLNHDIREVVEETQVFRIDHYLGKETVQNILAFRFANGIFEPIWNRRYIDHVQITVAEEVGDESRGGYYEEAGALRDMVQNHMFQLLALTAMEPPISFAPDVVRDERVK